MTSKGVTGVDVSPHLEKLEYYAHPSPLGMTWAQQHWHDPQAVTDGITLLTKEQNLKHGKGKAVVRTVLGAAPTAAQQENQANR